MKKYCLSALICFSLLFPLALKAKDFDPRLLEASRRAYAGETDAAKQLIEEYIQEHPDDPNGLFVKGVVFDWEGTLKNLPTSHQKETFAVFKEANDMAFHLWDKDRENVDRLIDIGNSYLFLGRKYGDLGSWFNAVLTAKKCQQHLEKAQKLAPDRVDGLLALGGFHYLAGNMPPGAAAFKGLLGIKGDKVQGMSEMKRSLSGQHPFVIDTQYALLNLQIDYEKNYPEALRQLEALQKQFPNNPELRWKRPQIMEKQDPKSSHASFLEFGDWCQKNSAHCHPVYVFRAYYDAGRVAKDQGDTTQSEQDLNQALQYPSEGFNEQKGLLHLWLGQSQEKKGDLPKALQQYQEAKKVPNLPKNLKKEIEESVKKLCEDPNQGSLKC